VLGVRLDVTQFDRRYLPVQQRMLIHPYSDAELCSTSIRCVKLEEMLATKLRCLLQRRHIADLFDLAYAVLINKQIEINRSESSEPSSGSQYSNAAPALSRLVRDLPLRLSGVSGRINSVSLLWWFDFDAARKVCCGWWTL